MNCSIQTNDREIVFKDKGNSKCKMIFLNPNRYNVVKIQIDGCVIKNGLRCDFMLKCPTYENYIEIKGKDIIHACKQIESTIKLISSDIRQYPKRSFVIGTGIPSCNGSTQLLAKRFLKEYNSSLCVKTNQHKVTL